MGPVWRGLRVTFIEVGDDDVSVEGLVGNQCAKREAINERRDVDGVEAVSVSLPKQCGSIFAHWASVSTKRSIKSLNRIQT